MFGGKRCRESALPAEILKITPERPETHWIDYAARLLEQGEVVAIPTDTLYGLAADPLNLSAVERIFRIKGRVESKGLPILIDSIDRARLLVRELPPAFFHLAQAFWPGALTLILPASDRVPLKVTGNTGRVALRWPKSVVVTALIGRFGGPVTGTSANLSGFPPCTNAGQVARQLGDHVPLILDAGDTRANLPSTIVDISEGGWRVVREGVIPEAEIARVLQSSEE